MRHNDLVSPWAHHSLGRTSMEDLASVGKSHRGMRRDAIFYERNMDCPVLAPAGKLLGAVEGVDDPHAVFLQSL